MPFFDRFGTSKWTPKCTKIEPQRPPRRSWSQVAAGSWFRNHFWSFLGPLGTPKIMLSLWRGAIFANFASRAREPEIAPPNNPKIKPKTIPGGSRMARNVAPNRCSNFDQISALMLTIWAQIGQKSASEPGARPEASREPFGRPFGFILASIWAPRGLMYELYRGARLLL